MAYNPQKIEKKWPRKNFSSKNLTGQAENRNPQRIERKWQKIWEKAGIYKTPDKVKGKKNFYHLVMFPYPSGDLHIGHWYNFGPGDVYARLKRAQGYNVMSPIGFDAFGLPAENAALRRRIHPKTWTYENIKRMRKQLRSLGTCYDWSREVITCDPGYYRWTQWMFLQLYKKGLAYRAKLPCNFCPSCKTVLANEQVIEGKCERCDSEVYQKEIEQWLFKISAFAEDLLKGLQNLDYNPPTTRQGKSIDWPETTKIMQKNWIGKSEGTEIKFKIQPHSKDLGRGEIPVFTTRPDTLFGATYLVLAPEHPIIQNLKSQILNFKSVERYVEESKKKTERERISEIKEKTGVEIKGIKAVNPANGREISIWVADYVLASYGTGAIMAVPCHDQRDWDFAKKYNLPIIEVIKPFEGSESKAQVLEKAYEGEGVLINSGRFNGMRSVDAKERMGGWLSGKSLAKKMVYYKLRDWLISRQRYWGSPIPMIFCQKCGWQPVPEKDLPVLLPAIKDFRPTGEGNSPLAKSKKFVETICPKCRGPAKRETDTMDTFVCSSWYYLRYADPGNEKIFASKKKLETWLPVNIYIGGAEHTVLHLLYSRFFTKALRDQGFLDFEEPFLRLRHQGIILGPDGQKMSKSRGNVVEPEEQIKRYGSDALRIYLCFMGPYSQGGPWNPKGIVGIYRFLQKVWNLLEKSKIRSPEHVLAGAGKNQKSEIENNKNLEKLLHKTIKKVAEDIENFRFNTAISALMILTNELLKETIENRSRYLKTLLLLLAPFAPHLTEELWQKYVLKISSSQFSILNSIHNHSWPKYNLELIKEETITLVVQVNGRVRDKMELPADISKKEARKFALSRPKIKKWLDRKEIKKVIFVPGKLINIVI